ncbi:TrbM/KikA/MpfK family conjugal transfer protein [Bordetella tumulicola]|uniref:TrbM/KikA/MpfK family conjugal transfer protein n=1 Tax=Bordetella tumulicola TaxID=1649133 RepID=UPI0039EE03E1
MQSFPAMQAGAMALVCALVPAAHAASADLLTGNTRLACEATLCLSTGAQPSECSPSLNHYFGIKKYSHGSLDWSATVSARRAFLSQCPASSDQGMPERIDAISRGAGKCDPDYLNRTYAATAYRWRKRSLGGDSGDIIYDVHAIPTVSLNKLPAYCVTYNDHAWTYDLSVRYVGVPAMGGHWVNAQAYTAAQAKWDADHRGRWASGWNFSLKNPRPVANSR